MRKSTTLTVLASTSVISGFVASFIAVPRTYALSIYDGVNAAYSPGMPTHLLGAGGILTTLVNILLFAIGALSVIMIIIGGLRYTVSAGNSSAVTAAKNTILYAIIGLVIAFLAYALINLVMSTLSGGFGGGNYAPTNT